MPVKLYLLYKEILKLDMKNKAMPKGITKVKDMNI